MKEETIMRYFNVIIIIFLTALSLAVGAKDYRGAELFSNESIKYGRFEMRMRVAYGSGTLSTFFLYYDNSWVGLPEPWQEIDLEVLGKNNDQFQSNIITGDASGRVTSEEIHNCGTNISEGYHTYTVEWTPDYIAWYFDGNLLRKTTGQQVTDCQQKNMSYRFNIWIANIVSWVGTFNPSILPLYQYINWLKYYTYTPGSGENGTDFTFAWQEDFNTFDSNRWGKGDWTFDENLVDFYPDNIVVKEGYCILCLTTNSSSGHSGNVPQDSEVSILPGQIENQQKMTSTIKITPRGLDYQRIYYVGLNNPSASIYSIKGSLLYQISGTNIQKGYIDIPFDNYQANSIIIIKLSDPENRIVGKSFRLR